MLIENNIASKNILDYKVFAPEEYEKLLAQSDVLKHVKIIHASAVPQGGGVAEILKSAVALERSLGLDARWFSLLPDEQLFAVTKKLHNLLQDLPQGSVPLLSQPEKEYYRDYNYRVAKALADLSPDVLIIHDPQPLAALYFMQTNKPRVSVCRIHIDMTSPEPEAFAFIGPFLESYGTAIFSSEEFVPKNFHAKRAIVSAPAIDPLSEKNVPVDVETIKKTLALFNIDRDRPLLLQTARFDPWKDPLGTIAIYRKVKAEVPTVQLVFAGFREAADDPTAAEIFHDVEEAARGDIDIKLLFNTTELKGNPLDTVINSLQRSATVVLHKSIREGFGLAVTEAMWKERVVIAGNVGGLKLQIHDGDTGFLVPSVDEAVAKVLMVIKDKKLRQEMGEKAKRTVQAHYLITRYLEDELSIILSS